MSPQKHRYGTNGPQGLGRPGLENRCSESDIDIGVESQQVKSELGEERGESFLAGGQSMCEGPEVGGVVCSRLVGQCCGTCGGGVGRRGG